VFLRERISPTISLGCIWTMILLISASWVLRLEVWPLAPGYNNLLTSACPKLECFLSLPPSWAIKNPCSCL
jgi:hypothetical protein